MKKRNKLLVLIIAFGCLALWLVDSFIKGKKRIDNNTGGSLSGNQNELDEGTDIHGEPGTIIPKGVFDEVIKPDPNSDIVYPRFPPVPSVIVKEPGLIGKPVLISQTGVPLSNLDVI